MISTVIGTATPNAPPIINVIADSKFASACTSRPDMPLLQRAPAPQARWVRMVKKRLTGSEEAVQHDAEAAPCLSTDIPVFPRAFPAYRRRRVITPIHVGTHRDRDGAVRHAKQFIDELVKKHEQKRD